MGKRKRERRGRKKPHFESPVVPKKAPNSGPHVPSLRKIPDSNEKRDYGKYFPAWRFSMLDVHGPFGFGDAVTVEVAMQLAKRLGSQEARTWNDIFTRDKHNNHANQVEKLAPEARRRLRHLKLDDFDELHSIRLSGAGRLYGVWREGVFYVLWWDRAHLVYPYKKKHT